MIPDQLASRRTQASANLDTETPAARQGDACGAPLEGPGDAAEIQQRALEILRQQRARSEPPPTESATPQTATTPKFADPIPARMLNEFVYCPRLFYYEFVESVFVESADTVRGAALHRRVDAGRGELPPPVDTARRRDGKTGIDDEASRREPKPPKTCEKEGDSKVDASQQNPGNATEPEVIHSRSVQMGSRRLGVTAKMDLVEVRTMADDLFSSVEVCPVDYKVGAPREGEDGNVLWDADRMQLGLQALILRENGYVCREGIIYYRATKQRVRLAITPDIEAWVTDNVAHARATAAGTIPLPLASSPKCPRCSLVTICLPDETRFLLAGRESVEPSPAVRQDAVEPPPASVCPPPGASPNSPRRLIAARDDTRALYLNTQGVRIGRKDEVLQIKQEQQVIDEVRLNDVSHVALFGNIQISTQAVQSLCEAEVPVTYFSMGGWFYGITRGHELKNVFLRIEQFRLARDAGFCLRLARQVVAGKIRNHRTLLMRNHLEPPAGTVLKLKQHAEAALRAQSREELLGIEGGAAAAYFGQFSGMLKIEDELSAVPDPGHEKSDISTQSSGRAAQLRFNFTHRNRRPPTDPINALLSLAYSLLAKDCSLAALAVGFDPYVGFYHQPRFGRPALALDLMEEFRPLVAESTVLSSVNNRVITPGDFVQAGEAVNLTVAGRRRFFQMYEQRMNTLLTHPVFEYKVSYRRALELQARMLAKSLTGEIPEYVPLITR